MLAPLHLPVLLFVLAGCADDGGPRLTAVSPTSAAIGDTVTLTGTRLCGSESDCTTAGGEVQIGTELPAIIAVIVDYADTSAMIRIPSMAPTGMTSLVVVVNDDSSNALPFEVTP